MGGARSTGGGFVAETAAHFALPISLCGGRPLIAERRCSTGHR
jgi:hypothetical protein